MIATLSAITSPALMRIGSEITEAQPGKPVSVTVPDNAIVELCVNGPIGLAALKCDDGRELRVTWREWQKFDMSDPTRDLNRPTHHRCTGCGAVYPLEIKSAHCDRDGWLLTPHWGELPDGVESIAPAKIEAIQTINSTPRFSLFSYLDSNSRFDYARYKSVQEARNKAKLGSVWVKRENIAFLADHISKHIGRPRFGLCHGTRRGREQEWFREFLNCEVIGTEISETAAQFPNTIQWDFHEIKAEWIDSVDSIYSNSFDHAYDPEKALNSWMSCVRPGGLCIIEHSSLHSPDGVTEADPFGADLVLMPYLIARWAKGRYGVRNLIPAPSKADHLDYLEFIVIQRFGD